MRDTREPILQNADEKLAERASTETVNQAFDEIQMRSGSGWDLGTATAAFNECLAREELRAKLAAEYKN